MIASIPEHDYHANAFDERPALSSSTIKTLLTRSPLHAWTDHPRLNPDWEYDDGDGRFDVGNAAHAMFLEQDESRVVVVYGHTDWKKKAAQEERAAIREARHIPMLEHQYESARALEAAIRDGARRVETSPAAALFTDGKPEQTVLCDLDGVFYKMRADWLHDDLSAVDDLKTTARVAAPEKIAALMVGSGYDVQAAFYLRCLEAATGTRPVFRFLFAETEPPYAVACYSPSPAMLALADQKINLAISIWKRCLERDEWPGYPARVMHVDPPNWEETRVFEREYREEAAA